jgi:hypothetical protein
MVECQFTMSDSGLPQSLDYQQFPLLSSIGNTIQIFIQDGLEDIPSKLKLVVSNHHSKCLTNEVDYNDENLIRIGCRSLLPSTT